MLARQHLHHSILLRCCGPILLHWQRCQRSPAVRQQVRIPGPCIHQEQAHRINGWRDSSGTSKDRREKAIKIFVVNILSSNETCICLMRPTSWNQSAVPAHAKPIRLLCLSDPLVATCCCDGFSWLDKLFHGILLPGPSQRLGVLLACNA